MDYVYPMLYIACFIVMYDMSDVILRCLFCSVMFFFKQKTAYEMRISDWSSDVCSSDLGGRRRRLRHVHLHGVGLDRDGDDQHHQQHQHHVDQRRGVDVDHHFRSEEHTSELQSLMRISYAVFCLKKNNTTTKLPNYKAQITSPNNTTRVLVSLITFSNKT